MTETIDACPECDWHKARLRYHGKPNSRAEGEGKYRCTNCGHTFDEPNTRPARNSRIPKRGIAARLAKANPDDVGGESA